MSVVALTSDTTIADPNNWRGRTLTLLHCPFERWEVHDISIAMIVHV
jgi:hypothetical protein